MILTRSVALIAVLVLAVTISPCQKKVTTVNGELVEVVSYVQKGVKPASPATKEVAFLNATKGGMLAILEKKSKKLYLLVGPAADSAFVKNTSAYFGVPTFVKGTVFSRNGVNLIEVQDIGKSIK